MKSFAAYPENITYKLHLKDEIDQIKKAQEINVAHL